MNTVEFNTSEGIASMKKNVEIPSNSFKTWDKSSFEHLICIVLKYSLLRILWGEFGCLFFGIIRGQVDLLGDHIEL